MQATLLLLMAGALAGAALENPVLKQLVERGVPMGDGTCVKLPPPTMPDGLDGAAQQEIVARIAGPTRRPADLARKSVVSPFVLKIGDASATGDKSRARTVDLWFIAYGRLELFCQQDFLQRLVESAESSKKDRLPFAKGILDREELKALGLSADDEPDRIERFFFSTFGLFDRVVVSATRRVVVTRHPDSVIVAAMIDPRFTRSSTHPNHWRSVERADRDEHGRLKLGPPQPYESAGLYGKITRMKDPPGALWIEYHHVFCEPEAWFSGTALLRSKLPMVVQDAVRTLRRRLADADTPPEG